MPTADELGSGVKTGSDLLLRRLAEPFDASEIKWKPQAVKGNRALAAAYINARAIMDRLDDVLGVDGWKDDYRLIDGDSGNVVCTLSVRVGGEWIGKSDVGSPSEQPDGGDRMKAAFSDALKRAAVKFGIGRYIYRMPQQWADYDPAKRQFVNLPTIPAAFLPAKAKPAANPSHVRGKEETRPDSEGRQVIGGVLRISYNECKTLDGLIRKGNINAKSFCEHYDITELAYLPSVLYSEAVKALEERIKRTTKVA